MTFMLFCAIKLKAPLVNFRIYLDKLAQLHDHMYEENYPIAFYFAFLIEMRLDNFLYAYGNVIMKVCLDRL